VSFNQIDKERLQIETSPEIVTIIRIQAAQERVSVSEVATKLICQALKRDPKAFGIGVKRTRRVRTATVAS
jgi:hypothetical protein